MDSVYTTNSGRPPLGYPLRLDNPVDLAVANEVNDYVYRSRSPTDAKTRALYSKRSSSAPISPRTTLPTESSPKKRIVSKINLEKYKENDSSPNLHLQDIENEERVDTEFLQTKMNDCKLGSSYPSSIALSSSRESPANYSVSYFSGAASRNSPTTTDEEMREGPGSHLFNGERREGLFTPDAFRTISSKDGAIVRKLGNFLPES